MFQTVIINSPTLKMEAICSSETSFENHRITPRHIPEDDTLYNHHCENIKPHRKMKFVFYAHYTFSIILWFSRSLNRSDAVLTFLNFYIWQSPGSPDHTQILEYLCLSIICVISPSLAQIISSIP
jgi:hypothetical protein